MTSTAKGRTAADRPSDVGGVEAAGQDARRHAGVDHGAGQAPVDGLAGAGRAAGDDGVDQHGVGAGVDEAAGGGGQDLGRRPGHRGVDAQRLDEADAGAGQPGGQLGDAVLGLVPVELEGVGLGGLDQLEDRAGVAAHDGHPGDERRHQPHELGGPPAGQDPGVGVGILDDEPERVGALLDGHGGVVLVGDPADLDPDGHADSPSLSAQPLVRPPRAPQDLFPSATGCAQGPIGASGATGCAPAGGSDRRLRPAHVDQGPDRLGRVGGPEDGGADEDGVGAGRPGPAGVVGAADGALGEEHATRPGASGPAARSG